MYEQCVCMCMCVLMNYCSNASDGGLAEVYPGADIQGEEGSEEDAARTQYAG